MLFGYEDCVKIGSTLDITPRKKQRTRVLQKVAPAATKNVQTTAASRKRPMKKSFRRALIRYAIVGVNLLIVGFASLMILTHSGGNAANFGAQANDQSANPLDRLSAADIAVNVARLANLPEQVAVTNYADTINAELETFRVDRDIAQIPQIITADLKTMADIVEYITKDGDTVSGLSAQFGVTSDSIKWSNDLVNDALPVGIKLLIPPTNGMLYTVRSGDTIDRIAALYKASPAQIIAFNDIELTGLKPGTRVFIPDGQKPAPVFNFYIRYGDNGYAPGWCTYYAAAHGGAPPGWGHARSWAVNAARTSGWIVSKVPVVGSIAQTTFSVSWLGHVGIVEDVKYENGEYYIRYSDMNGIAGFNAVGHSGWVPAQGIFQDFIYRIE